MERQMAKMKHDEEIQNHNKKGNKTQIIPVPHNIKTKDHPVR